MTTFKEVNLNEVQMMISVFDSTKDHLFKVSKSRDCAEKELNDLELDQSTIL